MTDDLFILAGEPSGDLQGAKLIEELLRLKPSLKIAAMAGPRMRQLPIEPLFRMEDLQVMGFIDVLFSLPKIMKWFFAVRKAILERNPKAVVCIDYPGFNLRLERSLKKKGYRGKLIHYICPTVWAWGKKRIPLMAENLDMLLTFFPFEKSCFDHTSLDVRHIGHPLTAAIPETEEKPRGKILALFPGSREKEIERNFPLQLAAARRLMALDPEIEVAVSISHPKRASQIREIAKEFPLRFVPPEKNYELMREAKMAIAKSGTVTLELALHKTPTVVCYAIRSLDVFLAQKIFKINLPFYCIVNIVAGKQVFPELFGPNLTEKRLVEESMALWRDPGPCRTECGRVRALLGNKKAAAEASRLILNRLA